MKLDSTVGSQWILGTAMGRIKGTIVWICIPFLAICWSGGTLGAPAHEPPLLNKAAILINKLQSSALSDCSLNIPRLVAASAYNTPKNCGIEDLETVLLQNLINRLEDLNKNSIAEVAVSSNLPAIPGDTYNSILNQYLEVRLLTEQLMTSRDAQIVQSALDALHTTFIKIIDGQLSNVELPNLCSKTLALNTQLKTTDAPSKVQDAVTDLTKSLTLALTGQSQVTILSLCDCLNDLETSIVTVVQNDNSEKLQYLLSNLVEAVTNVVVSGGDVGCNVIDVVKRYVASIKQAVQQNDNVRAGKIYSSVLNFEQELYKVLIEFDPTVTEVTSPKQNTTPLNPETEEDYLTEISLSSKAIFGDRTNLVRSAVEILLNIKKLQAPSTEVLPVSSNSCEATIEGLKQVNDLLKSFSTYPQTDSTHMLEMLVELLSTLPPADIAKVLDALDPVLEYVSDVEPLDATALVSNGELFIVKEKLVQQINDDADIVFAISGTYKLVDPKTNGTYIGSYAVQDGTIQSDPNGNIWVKNSGEYDVDLPQRNFSSATAPRDTRQGNFVIEDHLLTQIDENGNSRVTEDGIYSLSDQVTGSSKSGAYVVVNQVTTINSDGSTEITRSGLLNVDGPDATSSKPILESDGAYFLFDDHIFEARDSNGNYGNGKYNIKNSDTNQYQSGSYVIQEMTTTKNSDGSIDSKTGGLIYIDGPESGSTTDNSDPYLIIRNGSHFTFDDRLVYVKDAYGNALAICNGIFTHDDTKGQIITSGNYIVQNFIQTENPDGSTDVTKFGRYFNLSTLAYFKASPPSTSSWLNLAEASTSKQLSAKPFSVSKDSFEALINSLHSAKPVKPINDLKIKQPSSTSDFTPPTTETSPQTDDGENDNCPDSSFQNLTLYDATSIVNDGSTFIVDAFVTALLDPEGNVIGEIIQGTYYLLDRRTNISWSGSFEVEDSVIETIPSGQTVVTESGTFDVNPPNTNSGPKIDGQFQIKKYSDMISPEGTYSLTDPITNAIKSGNFVVRNIVKKTQPGGTIEIVKSGVLTVDQTSPTPLSSNEKSSPMHNGYILFDDHFFNVPDSEGNQGSGVYHIKDLTTNNEMSGTYVIQQNSTTYNLDGTVQAIIEGVIYVDGSDYVDGTLNIINGAKFVRTEQLAYVTDSYGLVTMVGNGVYSQTDPETGEIECSDYVILNIAITEDRDGSINVIKFGEIPIEYISAPSNTQAPTTTSPVEPHTDSVIETLSNIFTPKTPSIQNPRPTSQINPLIHPLTDRGGQTVKSSVNPNDDPTAVAINGASFVINEHIIPRKNSKGIPVDVQKSGTYSIMDHETMFSCSGNFEIQDFSVYSVTHGVTDVTQSGTFNVNPTNEGYSSTTQLNEEANFLIEQRESVVVDENGVPTATATGTYTLTNPNSGRSTSGTFVIDSIISKINSDGSIYLTKSGIMYVDEVHTLSPSTQSPLIGSDGYFLIINNIFPRVDSNGNRGTAVYNIKNPTSNESTSGNCLIQEFSTTNNSDGTVDFRTSGLIYVNNPGSNSDSTSHDPLLEIVNGAPFTFVDHLSYVTDPYGRIKIVGTGVFTQTDPETGAIRSRNYVIQDISTNELPDGSLNIIKSGTFSGSSPSPSTTDLTTGHSSSEVKISLQAVIDYLSTLNKQTSQKSSPLSTWSTATPSTSGPTSTSVSDRSVTSSNVLLPRCDVVSAINGESLSPGDVVVIQAENGKILLAKIQSFYDPVNFQLANVSDLISVTSTAKKVWTVLRNDFSKQGRSLIDTVQNSANPPCDA